MHVNELEFGTRVHNALNERDVTTVMQLAEKSEGELLKYRNFGKVALREVKDKLHELALSLGMKFRPVTNDGSMFYILRDLKATLTEQTKPQRKLKCRGTL
jgi:DNA-directed RNA polymerase alpha subunit